MFRANTRLLSLGRYAKEAPKAKPAAAAPAGSAAGGGDKKKKAGGKDGGKGGSGSAGGAAGDAAEDNGFVFPTGTKLDGLNFWNDGKDDPVVKDWAEYPAWVADLAKDTPTAMQQGLTEKNYRLYRRALSRAVIRQNNSGRKK